ncbi:MAG TPA: DUF5011 domain-containing protein, partial [Mollicutes bacterium]|nr:DUF5011 domain-containing protein [Mollicutes bacterium]
IAVPVITGIIKSSAKAAFESDAKLVLKAIDYKKLSAAEFDPSLITKNNLTEELGLSDVNYESVNFAVEDNVLIVSIIGKDKWDGLIACGTFRNMKVVENASQCEGDFIPPVLTVLGDNPVNMYIGETYTDAGAIALDNLAGNITDKIIITGTVNPNVPGEYTITYTIKDLFDNETTATRTINVIDNAFPIIDFNPNGNSIYAKSRTTTIDVRDLGLIDDSSLKYVWTLSDTEPQENEFNTNFINGGTVSTPTSVSGSYYLWARASDTVGNVTITSSNVFNLDNEKPVIKINGDSDVTINVGSIYSDEGATATDNIDATVTVTTTGSVNPNIVGTYTITYNATDSSGNTATPVTRTVNVIDVKAPVITILGDNPVTIEVKSAYSDAGATAVDDVEGDVTSKITTTSTVNTNDLGTYTVTYTVEDNSGNQSTATRIVKVVDTTKPTIAFGTNGNSTYAKSKSTTVTVSDNLSVNTNSLKYLWNTSTIEPAEASFGTTLTNGGAITTPAGVTGDYYLWILAKDNSGNTTITGSNVFKLDNTKPVITITGSNPATVSGGGTYSDAGATASDAHSGLNGSISTTGSVNPNKLGTYTVTYNISDKAGNTATLSRTVNVVDNILPTVTGVSVPTTWTSGNKTITVTGSDTGLSGIAGYYISTSSTKPTTASAWTASTSTTWTVSRGAGTYYIWIKDGAGNISSTYKSVNVTNIDANAPTVTAKGSSYTIIEGASNAISSTYFNISANGTAPISSTTCIDTSKSNATVTNTSTLAVGTHVIKCTVTKSTGLNAYAQTTIVVEPKIVEYAFNYTGSLQTFTAERTGTYKLEVWGAQGGGPQGGKGGYAVGTKTLTAGDKLYVEVGGQGSRSSNTRYTVPGGYGGGGDALTGEYGSFMGAASGGGASTIYSQPDVLYLPPSSGTNGFYIPLEKKTYSFMLYGYYGFGNVNKVFIGNYPYAEVTSFDTKWDDLIEFKFTSNITSSSAYFTVTGSGSNYRSYRLIMWSGVDEPRIIVAGGGGGQGVKYTSSGTSRTLKEVIAGGAGGGETGGGVAGG